jgi:Cu2+-exporting ATPase
VLPGETFPADGFVVRGQTLADEALLTGESTALQRGVGDTVIAGSHNLAAVVDIQVERIGDQTRYGQIVALMEQASVSKPAIAKLVDSLAKPFLILVLLAAALSCLGWWYVSPEHAVMIAVAVLVVTCPCALSLATPAAMLASAGALARNGVLVRQLGALETLSKVDTVVFDKTGTLTCDTFELEAITVRPDASREQALSWAATLAAGSLHPISRALTQALQSQDIPIAPLQGSAEQSGAGVSAIAPGFGKICLGSAQFTNAQEHAVPGLATYLSDANGWLATFSFREQLRQDAEAAVAQLHQQDLRVCMYSGDQEQTAQHLGQSLGIDEARGALTPDGKLAALHALQATGRRVAMIGDGLNDAPILAGADVSFAFGSATPITHSRSDLVVLNRQLLSISQTFTHARKTLRIVRQNLGWAVAYNLITVPLAIAGYMPAWAAGLGMASSSLLVVLNALRLTRLQPLHSTIGSAPTDSAAAPIQFVTRSDSNVQENAQNPSKKLSNQPGLTSPSATKVA